MEPLVPGKLAGFSSEHKVSALVGVPQQARWEPMHVIPGISNSEPAHTFSSSQQVSNRF